MNIEKIKSELYKIVGRKILYVSAEEIKDVAGSIIEIKIFLDDGSHLLIRTRHLGPATWDTYVEVKK